MKYRAIYAALFLIPSFVWAQEEVSVLSEVEVVSNVGDSFTSEAVQMGIYRGVDPIDVPQATDVITRELLDAQNADTIYGALRNTAGVVHSQLNGATYDNISIRGVEMENRQNFRLNGSLPIINLVELPLENKERVEVLKGASAFYYGLVPPSGIVNLVTKRAGPKEIKSMTLEANQHGGHSAHIDYGNRFGAEKQLGARVNLLAGEVDVGIDNFEGERNLASIALDLKATDKLMFKLDVEHYQKHVSEPSAISLLPAVNGRINLPPTPDNDHNLGSKWMTYDAEATNVLFRTDYVINDDWSVLFEAGSARTERDRHFSRFEGYNEATGNGKLNVFFTRDQVFRNKNYRGELFGRVATGSVMHEVTLGYTQNEESTDNPLFNGVLLDQNYYDPVNLAERNPPAPRAYSDITKDDKGVYLMDRILLSERWQALVGVRYTDYQSVNQQVNANTGAVTRSQYSTHETSPTGSLLFKLLPNVTLYTSYIEGLEESGIAPIGSANEGTNLDPAKSRQREFGVKTKVLQNMLVQLAYFEIERATTFQACAACEFTLNGESEFKGWELSAVGEISNNWAIAASALLMNAEQRNRANAATYGNVTENTPEKTASLFAEYKVPGVQGLAVSGGLYYVGERAVNNQNQAFIDDYTIYSAGARYTTLLGKERATFQLTVDNLTDKDYWSTAGNGLLGVGLPRMVKASMRLDF